MFVSHVQAATQKCFYSSNDKTMGSFDLAELTIKDASKKNASFRFSGLKGPKLKCNIGSDIAGGFISVATGVLARSMMGPGPLGLIFGASASSKINDSLGLTDNFCSIRNRLNTADTEDYSTAASKNMDKKLKYYDINRKTQVVKQIPGLELTDGECPQYIGVVINDIGNTSNVQVYAGNSTLHNSIDSYIENNPDYNYVIWGERYQVQGKNPNEVSTQDEEPIDTCDGLLGIKDKATGKYEYTEGSVGYLLQQIFDYMKMAAIIFIFAFSVIDYAKAIASQDTDQFKKANKNLLKRILFGIVFFLIPEVVNLILGIIDSSTCGIQ